MEGDLNKQKKDILDDLDFDDEGEGRGIDEIGSVLEEGYFPATMTWYRDG